MTALGKISQGVRVFASDVANGFFEISHNGFALLGLTVAFAAITLTFRPDLRQAGESKLMGWLHSRHEVVTGMEVEPDAIDRATAANPQHLPKAQAAVAYWLSKKYRVAPEPISALVAEAYRVGDRARLEPTLILAIMAIESGFNPFAQSSVGAQGLMQVMTRVHGEKYDNFGGAFAAFDPVSNLRVGVRVLQDCITRAGSIEGGLRYYVGAANIEDDGGYAVKVLAERSRLQQVAQGHSVPVFNAPIASVPAPAARNIPVVAPAKEPTPELMPGRSPPSSAAADKIASLSLR